MSFQALLRVIWENQGRGVRVDDAQRAIDAAWSAPAGVGAEVQRQHDFLRMLAHDLALNRGRPHDALAGGEIGDFHARGGPRSLIYDALYWGGDTVAAAAAARKIETTLASPRPSESDPELHTYYYDICTLEQWRGWPTKICGRRPSRSRGSARRQGSGTSSGRRSMNDALTFSMPGTPRLRGCPTRPDGSHG